MGGRFGGGPLSLSLREFMAAQLPVEELGSGYWCQNVDRRVDLASLRLCQESSNYAFHKCIVKGFPREPASVEEGRDD